MRKNSSGKREGALRILVACLLDAGLLASAAVLASCGGEGGEVSWQTAKPSGRILFVQARGHESELWGINPRDGKRVKVANDVSGGTASPTQRDPRHAVYVRLTGGALIAVSPDYEITENVGLGDYPAVGYGGELAYCTLDDRKIVVSSLAHPERTTVVQEYDEPFACRDMSWSRDGTLAFVDGMLTPDYEPMHPTRFDTLLYTFTQEDGVVEKPVTGAVDSLGDLSWSADGKRVAFGVYGWTIVDAATGAIEESGEGEQPSFSPVDPDVFAFIERETSSLHVLRGGETVATLPLESPDSVFTWSPDGEWIAATATYGVYAWHWPSDEYQLLTEVEPFPEWTVEPSIVWLEEP